MFILYEPLDLREGHTLLEIGLGTGYSVAVAREIVGEHGLVVSVEIDPQTYENGKIFIERTGLNNIVLIRGDGCLGYPELAPYDRICITAACQEIPSPLIDQLKIGGKLIAPVIKHGIQNILLLEKTAEGVETKIIQSAIYNIPFVPLIDTHGLQDREK